MGIQVFWYDLFCCGGSRYPFLILETQIYDSPAPEIYSLRKLVAASLHAQDEADLWWRQLGAMILGPFVTAASEWVLDLAEENGISRILPLMREGLFLKELLDRAADYREKPFHVEPLFVSRKSVYMPSLSIIRDEEIKVIIETYNIRIKDVFKALEIEHLAEPFAEYLEMDVKKTRQLVYKDTNLFDHFRDYLLSDEIKSAINESAQRNRHRILQYLIQTGFEEKCMSLDVGCRGSIQNCMEKILTEAGIINDNLHLLFVSKDEAMDKVIDKLDIRGFIDATSEKGRVVANVFVRLLELFFMCDAGTTIAYRDEGDKVVPVTEKIDYPGYQLKQIRAVQEGILAFQDVFLSWSKKKKQIAALKNKPGELFQIVTRLFKAPLFQEAKRLGNWFYDQNFGANVMQRIIRQEDVDFAREKGFDVFFIRNSHSSIKWYTGVQALLDPLFFFKMEFLNKNSYHNYCRILFAQRIVAECRNIPSVVIVGAGQAGREIYDYIRLCHSDLQVEAFTDNNSDLQGLEIKGVPIKSIKKSFTSSCYVIGSFAFINELISQVVREKGTQVKIISY